MKLIYTETQEPVVIGDKVTSRGEAYIVTAMQPPHKPSSTGRVYVKSVDGQWEQGYFPSVFNMEWKG